MTRSLQPTLRRWRRDLEPVVLPLGGLGIGGTENWEGIAKAGKEMALALGRPVMITAPGFVGTFLPGD